MNNGLYLQLLLWLFSTKQDLTDFLQHPVEESMIIAIRLPNIHSPQDIISIAFFNNQRHYIINLPNRLLSVARCTQYQYPLIIH